MDALLVVENFLDYVKGDFITDVKKMKQLQDSEWQSNFVRTTVPKDSAPK